MRAVRWNVKRNVSAQAWPTFARRSSPEVGRRGITPYSPRGFLAERGEAANSMMNPERCVASSNRFENSIRYSVAIQQSLNFVLVIFKQGIS